MTALRGASRALLACVCLGSGGQAFAAPVLVTDTGLSTAGYYRLSWVEDGGRDFELQEASSDAFSIPRTLYQGPDTATLLSGRADGTRFYRVRDLQADGTASPWSNTVEVRVGHHSLTRAFLFFSVGLAIFLATLLTIIRGHREDA